MTERGHARIAVTGASGALGGRVARRLAAHGAATVLLGRTISRLPELPGAVRRGPAAYGDAAAMREALRGCDTLFLVSGGLSGRRFEEHRTAIEAARSAGVGRVVYLSLLSAGPHPTFAHSYDHWQTEQYLSAQPVTWTILRPSVYARMLTGRADPDGVVRGPAGAGLFAPIDHDDLADVAAAVLMPGHPADTENTVITVTGPRRVTWAEAAAELTTATGRRFTFLDETEAVSRARRGVTDAPDEVERWVSWFLAIRRGEFDALTDAVPRLAGHPARTVAAAVAAALREHRG